MMMLSAAFPVYHQDRWRFCAATSPDGAVMKPAASRIYINTGLHCFDSYPEMKAAVDDENLDVTADHVMVFRNAGPVGGPAGMGMLPSDQKSSKGCVI